jgi:anti-sigma-K factor RskA
MRLFVLGLLAASALAAAERRPTHRFILLLFEGPAFDAAGSHASEYRDWAAGLRREGRQVTGDEILAPEVALPAAPQESRDDRLAGYFVIGAADLADAATVARRCPHLRHGGRVVVRPLGG